MDVFRPILNRTLNERLKLEIQNLQCYPSDEVKQKWDKFQEVEKTSGHVFEDEELPENSAYEYYDETELNGTLFYFDMRHLLNCSGEETPPPIDVTTPMVKLTKGTTSPVILVPTTPKPDQERNTKIGDRGLLDLSAAESTTPESPVTLGRKSLENVGHNEIVQDGPIFAKEARIKEKKDNTYTTSRLATVSAKPIDHKDFDDHDMASDEAKPDRIKAHRSVQDEETPKYKVNNANRNLTCVPILVLMILCFRVFL